MSRRGVYVTAALVAVGLFLIFHFREIQPKISRFIASEKHTFTYSQNSQKTNKSRQKSNTSRNPAQLPTAADAEPKIPVNISTAVQTPEMSINAENEKKVKAAAEKLEQEKVRLMEEDTRLKKAEKEQEKARQKFEKAKQELEEQKKWLKQEVKRFEDYKKANLKKPAKKTGDPYHPDKKVDDAAIREKLEKLKAVNHGLWQDLDPLEIHKKWPGMMLDGDYMLRKFVDPSDRRALGMSNKPQDISEVTEAGAEDRFFQLSTINHLHCADKRRMGNFGDGGWDICVSGPYEPQEGCLVYSFGINNDFTFDDAMGQIYGCQVKSYDPSMKQGDHKRSEHVFFYKIGLGKVDAVNTKGWKLMSLNSILKQNGHTDKIIDYLKIDIEFSEWAAFEVMLQDGALKNVRQFAFEYHTIEVHGKPTSKLDYLRFYNLLLGIEKQGFRRYHFHFNPFGRFTSKVSGKERTCCYELYYININFLKDS